MKSKRKRNKRKGKNTRSPKLSSEVNILNDENTEAVKCKDNENHTNIEPPTSALNSPVQNRKWAIFTIASGVVALLAGLATVFQAYTSNESIIIAKEQFRVSNRPYFILAHVDTLRFAEGESLATRVHLKNVGNTPAFDVSVTANIESFADSFPDQPIYSKVSKKPSSGIIAQHDTAFVHVSTVTKMNLAIMSELLTGKITLYVHGVIKYKDIFKNIHETTFCGRFNPRRNQFVFCEKYNADKE